MGCLSSDSGGLAIGRHKNSASPQTCSPYPAGQTSIWRHRGDGSIEEEGFGQGHRYVLWESQAAGVPRSSPTRDLRQNMSSYTFSSQSKSDTPHQPQASYSATSRRDADLEVVLMLRPSDSQQHRPKWYVLGVSFFGQDFQNFAENLFYKQKNYYRMKISCIHIICSNLKNFFLLLDEFIKSFVILSCIFWYFDRYF
jgi:hypothetical protein